MPRKSSPVEIGAIAVGVVLVIGLVAFGLNLLRAQTAQPSDQAIQTAIAATAAAQPVARETAFGQIAQDLASDPTLPPATPVPSAAPSEAPSVTIEPSATMIPASPTITPTESPPTETPAPTSSPTPIPPQEFTGRGAKVVHVVVAELSRVYLGHEGKRNFIVRAYAADGSDEGLVNEIGYYAGNRLLMPATYDIEIKADGPWLIRVTPMSWDETASGAMEGKGDDIRGMFTPPISRGVYRFTHEGQHNFIVNLVCDTTQDGIVNEIGTFNGEFMVSFEDAKGCLWDVQADGAWTIAPK